ncbi:IS4 family transposase [bacterium]|nr:IS4 family transposase [bacterium]MBU1024629.1 IS4 family transposase [bacterium]
MSHINTIFNQVLHLIPRHQFDNLVRAHSGDRYVKEFTCFRQFITLMYGQIKGRDSLRDIVTGLNSQRSKFYHIGLQSVARSTLADANNSRDWHIYEGIFNRLLERCLSVTPKNGFKFDNPFYSLDSTTIDLCLSIFPWAKFRKTKGALKIHCLLDQRGSIPSFVVITKGAKHDIRVAKESDLPLQPDSIIAFDRAYIDYEFLYDLHSRGIYFVTRAKKNLSCTVTGLHKMPPNVKGLVCDMWIRLEGYYQSQNYPEELRLIEWHDEATGRDLSFLTNNFKLAASTIAGIYKSRWQIELFFKWIKQNLKIKSFLGTSVNAVMTQIFVAMCYYLLLTYIKFQTKYGYTITDLGRILSEILMERVHLLDILTLKPVQAIKRARDPSDQLTLF